MLFINLDLEVKAIIRKARNVDSFVYTLESENRDTDTSTKVYH